MSNLKGGLEEENGTRSLRYGISVMGAKWKLYETAVSLGVLTTNVTRSGKRLRGPSVTEQHSESTGSMRVDCASLLLERISSCTCIAHCVKHAANSHSKQRGNVRATQRFKNRGIGWEYMRLPASLKANATKIKASRSPQRDALLVAVCALVTSPHIGNRLVIVPVLDPQCAWEVS